MKTTKRQMAGKQFSLRHLQMSIQCLYLGHFLGYTPCDRLNGDKAEWSTLSLHTLHLLLRCTCSNSKMNLFHRDLIKQSK